MKRPIGRRKSIRKVPVYNSDGSIVFNLRRERLKRQAVHGRGDGWVEVSPGEQANWTGPTMDWAPQFGGRWRNNLPGSGDQHINDDSDKEKSTRGTATDGDFDPKAKSQMINDKLDKGPVPNEFYLVTYRCREGENPGDKAEDLQGQGIQVQVNGTLLTIMATDFDQAMRAQRLIPGAAIERKEKKHAT